MHRTFKQIVFTFLLESFLNIPLKNNLFFKPNYKREIP